MASSKRFMVTMEHPVHGLLQALVEENFYRRIIAKDPDAIATFVAAAVAEDPEAETSVNSSVDEATEPLDEATAPLPLPPTPTPVDEATAPLDEATRPLPPTPTPDDTNTQKGEKWTAAKEKALLIAYKGPGIREEKSGKKSARRWSDIAAAYNKLVSGSITGETARLKIRSLQAKYGRLIQHNNKSGNDPKEIDEELEIAFGREGELAKKTVINSSTYKKKEAPTTDDESSASDDEAGPSAECVEKTLKRRQTQANADAGDRKKRPKVAPAGKRTGAEVVIDYMREANTSQQQLQKEQFEVKCSLAREMIGAMKDLKK